MKPALEQQCKKDEVIESIETTKQAANERPISDNRDSLRWLFDDRRERGRRLHSIPFIQRG